MNNVSVIHIKDLTGNWKGNPHFVYIGRPSPLGNPFKIGPGCSRDDAVKKYARHLIAKMLTDNAVSREMNRLMTLLEEGDITLVCYCKPNRCHGDMIAQYMKTRAEVNSA